MTELRFPNEGSIPEFLAALASPMAPTAPSQPRPSRVQWVVPTADGRDAATNAARGR